MEVTLFYNMRKVWNSEIFQGKRKRRKYFEGWYFKQVSTDGRHIYSIIPGIAFGNSKSDESHAFIQFINGRTGDSDYFTFPVSDFNFSKNRFEIEIGNNKFSNSGISLKLGKNSLDITGDLEFKGITTLPFNLFSPGAMGWYSFVPFMECYHGLVSLDHGMSGSLSINNKILNFTGGRGYIEKDWGSSFPSSWIWLQSNNFDKPGISVMLSIARIPWMGNSFTGFLCFFLLDGKIFQFASYTGAILKHIALSYQNISVLIEDKNHSLQIDVKRKKGGMLIAPVSGTMGRRITESINSNIEVIFSSRQSGNIQYSGKSHSSGLEIMGDIHELGAEDI